MQVPPPGRRQSRRAASSSTAPLSHAVGYLRVSTEEQGRSGLGLAAQEASIRAACACEGWTLSAIHRDVESGGKDAREGLQQALSALQAGYHLVVNDQSRLGRRFASLALIEELEDRGVRVYVAASRRFADSSLLTAVEGGMAVEERRKVRERTRAALAAKKERGEWLGQVPFGFRRSPEGRLEEDPDAAALRQRALRLRRQGRSLREVARALGVSKSTLHRALRDNLRTRRVRWAA